MDSLSLARRDVNLNVLRDGGVVNSWRVICGVFLLGVTVGGIRLPLWLLIVVFFNSILDEGEQFRGISYGCVIPSLSVIIGLSSKAIGWG